MNRNISRTQERIVSSHAQNAVRKRGTSTGTVRLQRLKQGDSSQEEKELLYVGQPERQ